MARPREFDPDDALDKAMHVFWARGYHDTSIRDLVAGTGVNYYGLYSVFDSKHGLFLAALDRYRDTVTSELLEGLRQPGPLVPALSAAYGRLGKRLRAGGGRVGCMMCNTAAELAPHDKDAAAKVAAHRRQLHAAFRDRLVEAQKTGHLPRRRDVEPLAAFLTTTAYTLGLLLRMGADDAELNRHLEVALRAVG